MQGAADWQTIIFVCTIAGGAVLLAWNGRGWVEAWRRSSAREGQDAIATAINALRADINTRMTSFETDLQNFGDDLEAHRKEDRDYFRNHGERLARLEK